MIEDILEIFDGKDVEVYGKTISIENKRMTKGQFQKYLQDEIRNSGLPDKIKADYAFMSDTDKKQHAGSVYDELVSICLRVDTDFDLEYFKKLQPVIDIGTSEKKMVNIDTGLCVSTSHSAWCEIIQHWKPAAKIPVMPVRFVYNPYKYDTSYDLKLDKATEIKVLNSYVPTSSIRKALEESGSRTDDVELPVFFKKFCDHLFLENQEQIDHFLDQLYLMFFKRCELFMCFITGTGVGKQFLFDVLSALLGPGNAKVASRSLMRSNFNSDLEDTRLLFFDEFPINMSNHMELKRLANDRQPIEKKGLSPENKKVFYSCMTGHNSLSSFYVESGDRRFQFYDCTDVKWSEASTEEERVAFYSDMVKQGPQAHQLLAYIYDRGESRDIDPHYLIKSKTFYEAVEESTPSWLRVALEHALKGKESVSMLTINKEASARDRNYIPEKKSTLNKHLEKYEYREGVKVGKAITGPNRKVIISFSTEMRAYVQKEVLNVEVEEVEEIDSEGDFL